MSKKKPFIINGRHVLAGFVVFFGIIIAVNIVFVSLANTSFPGESVKKPYEQGVRYNETIAARELAVKLGWNITWSLDKTNADVNAFVVKVVDADGPVDGLKIEIALMWAGYRDADILLALKPMENGVYRGQLDAKSVPPTVLRFTGLAVRATDGAKMTFAGKL
ncbi:hypothetical protein MNBD_ALPHA06-1817 [hydrothermal vent metagenome]|uniref:Type cbb3 cytochrome oxidase biogenesis protein CcoH n=1 Tax=hydrothermal vent metagenome TaxID=652676 RepID=A0A3B0RKS6_9ZZZZ